MTSSLSRTANKLLLMQIATGALVGFGPFIERALGLRLLEATATARALFGGITVLGLLYLCVSLLNLGRSLTPNPIPKDSSRLVTGGLYAFSRHPIYSSMILTGVGWTGLWGSWASAIGLAALVISLKKKAMFEEALLLQRYGPAYETYMKRVNRFLPWKTVSSR